MKKSIIILIGILSIVIVSCSVQEPITSFEECANMTSSTIQESYPPTCTYNDMTFVKNVSNANPPATNETACTKEYEPVCATVEILKDSKESLFINKTYPNDCVAKNDNGDIISNTPCNNTIDFESMCNKVDGNWLDEHYECEGMNPTTCDLLGGSSNDCASACRHDPNATMCTMQCVLVCSFS